MWMRFVGFVMRKKGIMITSSLVVSTPEMHGPLEIWHINRRPLLWSIELPRAVGLCTMYCFLKTFLYLKA